MTKKAIKLKNGLAIELDENEMTASVIFSPTAIGSITIPKYVEHELKKYHIIEITSFAFHRNSCIESITFPEDSSLKRIHDNAFIDSSLTSLSIPESLEDLSSQWSFGANLLTDIKVSPQNKRFIYVNGTFLLKKEKSGNNFDNLIFVRRNIEGEILVPKIVRFICESSFYNCRKVESILFENSSLQTIGGSAFIGCQCIQKVGPVPKSVRYVGNECFEYLEKLESIEFLSSEIEFGLMCFWGCSSLFCISFPNAKIVKISKNSLKCVDEEIHLFFNCGATVSE